MLCKRGTEKEVRANHLKWVGNQKFDGCRFIAVCDEEIRLKGRSGIDYTNNFPEIVEELKGFKGILDGEIVAKDFQITESRVHTQNPLKRKLLSQEYPAVFYVFDVLSLDGKDLRDEILLERVKILIKIGFKSKKSIKLVEYTADLINLLETAKKEKWEGIVIKNPTSRYSDTRSWNWLKIKLEKFKDIEFNSYEINPAGVRIETLDKEVAIQVSGSSAINVRNQIESCGSATIEVKYLNETKSGKLRMPVFSKLKW